MIVKPVRYDFPDKMRGLSSAEREVRRLERSMAIADSRGDTTALGYLDRRHQRARQALHTLRRGEQDDALGLGSPAGRAQACADTRGGRSAA